MSPSSGKSNEKKSSGKGWEDGIKGLKRPRDLDE